MVPADQCAHGAGDKSLMALKDHGPVDIQRIIRRTQGSFCMSSVSIGRLSATLESLTRRFFGALESITLRQNCLD